MRRIAIIGSGIAGLLTAHGLRRAGHQVTLFSDRSAEQWLRGSKPTGTAGRFDLALSYERELGLAHWESAAKKVEGISLVFCPVPGNRLLTLTARLARPGVAIDVRLQSHRWMLDLEERGGTVAIESVTVPRLDEIAAAHDLTIVAAGKAELANLFERDGARSVYDRPQRNLAMVVTRGARHRFDGVPFVPVKFNLFGTVGEMFWVPYHHYELGPSWNLVFEAKPGGAMDLFGDAKSGADALAIAKRVIRDLAPWDHEWAKEMELADEHGWLVGKVAPTIRKPVGRLPSGRVVASVGDTAMVFDPVGGQGANNGTKMARHLVEAIVARGDRPFDEAWMSSTFEAFYADHGAPAYTFNNLLLEPITAAGKELLIAQYGSDGVRRDGRQAIADAFAANFADPRQYTHLFTDLAATRAFIAEKTGGSWRRRAIGGRLAIGAQQLRQKLGLAPHHPLAPDAAMPAEAAVPAE
ncbi:MAG TPA: styrene monooxygenase/indole monooxygenase family protein [Kofleriaceae bacterium]|nr:styrene monooxygenase/indole monooxygenase family protein [Kofleriaceae bacterium]